MGRYRILSKKWLFWPVFAISTIALHVVLFVVTGAFIYAARANTTRKFFVITTWLEIVDINFLVIVGILILIYAVDTLLSIKKFKKGFYYFYFVNDPLLFRLEALLAVLFLGLLTVPIYAYLNDQALLTYARGLIFDISYVVAMLLFGNSIISFVEMYQWFKKRCLKTVDNAEEQTGQTKSKTTLLLQYLKDEEFYEMFQAYCLKELSSENLYVFSALDEAKDNEEMPFHLYKYLIEEHIRANSNFEVNITSQTRAHCLEVYDTAEKNHQSAIEYDKLKGLYVEILNNLADTWARFTTTNQYLVFGRKREQLGQMFGVDDTETPAPRKRNASYVRTKFPSFKEMAHPWIGAVSSDYKERLLD